MKKFILFLIFIVSILSTSCEVAPFIGPAINAYVYWKEGEASCYYAIDAEHAYSAMKRVLNNMDYDISKDETNKDGSYSLIAGSKDKFKIKITQIEPYVTRINIRINFMGDKPYAELIYRKLANNLDVIDYTKYERQRWFNRKK